MRRVAQSLLSSVFTSFAGALIAGYSLTGLVYAAAPPGGDNLRATRASVQDISDGKRVAEASCMRCHGLNGVSTAKGTPHIAGQRPAYLHMEMRAYQTGGRADAGMENAVKFLSDDALFKVAAYYASLLPPAPSGGKPAAMPDPVQAGKAAAAGCGGCHGDNGISKTPGTPNLVGFDPKYFAVAVGAYKGGERKHDMMKTLVAGLSGADISNLGLFYALQKPARAQTPAPGDQAAGKVAAAAACAGCHGDLGVSGNAATPSLAGQDAQYFVAALREYKEGARKDESMRGLAASLDEKAMRNLAAFYAALQPQAPKVSKPLTLAQWAERCERCHGVNGNSSQPLIPALAAQRADYTEKVLHAYRKGERKNTTMAAMSAVLTEAEVEALAAHYAQQKPRAVVYVQQPGK